METSKSINKLVTNNTNTIVKEAVKKPVSTASNINKENDQRCYMINREDQKNSIQHSSDIAKDIVCSIIKNSDKSMNFTKEEAIAISQMYDIIYRRIEILKRISTTYGKKKTPTN